MQNMEISTNEIQKISTLRRILPQVRKIREFLVSFTIQKVVCFNFTADFRNNGKEFWHFQFGWILGITINCDSIVNWPQQRLESRWNDSRVRRRNIMVVWVICFFFNFLLNYQCHFSKCVHINFFHNVDYFPVDNIECILLPFSLNVLPLASFAHVAHPIGSLLSGPLCDKIGRRRSFMFVSVPLLISWIMLGFSQSFPIICFGFLTLGLCMGLNETPSITYVECNHRRRIFTDDASKKCKESTIILIVFNFRYVSEIR